MNDSIKKERDGNDVGDNTGGCDQLSWQNRSVERLLKPLHRPLWLSKVHEEAFALCLFIVKY